MTFENRTFENRTFEYRIVEYKRETSAMRESSGTLEDEEVEWKEALL